MKIPYHWFDCKQNNQFYENFVKFMIESNREESYRLQCWCGTPLSQNKARTRGRGATSACSKQGLLTDPRGGSGIDRIMCFSILHDRFCHIFLSFQLSVDFIWQKGNIFVFQKQINAMNKMTSNIVDIIKSHQETMEKEASKSGLVYIHTCNIDLNFLLYEW